MSRLFPQDTKCRCATHRRCIDSRWDPRGYRRRRYVCNKCERRWSTVELEVTGQARDMRRLVLKTLNRERHLPKRELDIMRLFAKAVARVTPGAEGSLADRLEGREG